MSWQTEEQDDVPRGVSFRGAELATEIERHCGVRHSVRAVEMRVARIRCSAAAQTARPQRGAPGMNINQQTGMCPLCTERYHLE